MALPRSVSLDTKNRLISSPVSEMEQLRKDEKTVENLKIGSQKIEIPCIDFILFIREC